ncbi:hypothetical protein K439DRAFT_1619141 [Ramaria rubella]|nr:hypothetical protein K439DRAFT_1619141 [Ramaria rubella]
MHPELNNYVNLTTIRIEQLLSWFKSNQLLSAGSGVTWSNDPQASLRDVSAPEDAATEFSPSKREHLVQHIHAFSESSKFHGLSNMFKVAANISVLACSTMFFLHSSNSPTYFQDLIASLDHIQMEPEHKLHISHIFNQFKGQRRLVQIALILAALAHSPLFVLDSSIQLGERSLNSVSITGTQAIMSALLPPPATHSIHLSMEQEIWKLLARFVGTLSFQPMNATSQTSSLDLERFFVLDDTQVLEDNEVSFLKTPFEHRVDLKWKPVILVASSEGGEEQLDTEAGPSNQGVGVGLSEKIAEALPSINNQGQEGKDKGSIRKAPIMPAKPVCDGKRGGKADKGKGKAKERPSKKRKLYHTTYKVFDNDFKDCLPACSLPQLENVNCRVTRRGNAKMAYQMWHLSVTPETQKYEVIWPHSLAKDREIMQSVIASQVTCVLYNQDEPYVDGLPISDVFPLSFSEAVTNSDVSLDHIDMCE